jgi:hypothetical protein
MRTVLIGSDFMYDSDNNLKLLEINTALGWDTTNKLEDDSDCLDLTSFDTFVKSNNFKNIQYVGELERLHAKLSTYCLDNSITYEFHAVGQESITVPYIEDNNDTLIIRSSYDTTALVDDSYCRDKVGFMKLTQSQSFGSKFAYLDETGNLVNNIDEIKDNGVHPNFILKSRYPGYNIEVYPKLFKVTSQAELDNVISNNVTSDYFLMEFYVNVGNTWNGHLKVIRSLNLLVPPNLESISIGQYTKVNPNFLLDNVTYNNTTFQINDEYRDSYVSAVNNTTLPKILDTDLIELADGTFKTPSELVVGDLLKTIDIPNPNNIDNGDFHVDYMITYNELVSGTTYSTNALQAIKRLNTFTYTATLTFDDGNTWKDTEGSFYLIDRNNDVQFLRLQKLVTGDKVILIDTKDNNLTFVSKTISSVTYGKELFSGWEITVEGAHLFLTKNPNSTSNESFASYVTIEHNALLCPLGACYNCSSTCASCPKTVKYCIGASTCSTTKCV